MPWIEISVGSGLKSLSMRSPMVKASPVWEFFEDVDIDGVDTQARL